MAKISPSILSADFMNLGRDIQGIGQSGADYIHVDVMDGLFVPNISIGIPVVASLKEIAPLPLDVHLMIDRPSRYVEAFCTAGADILTLHLEADTPEETRNALQKIRSLGKKAGLSIKPATPVTALLPFLPLCDLILIMTVEPGFGGQKFMENQMEKLQTLRPLVGAEVELEVDGGVNEATAAICRENGANVLVAGSAYFKSADKAAFVKRLKG